MYTQTPWIYSVEPTLNTIHINGGFAGGIPIGSMFWSSSRPQNSRLYEKEEQKQNARLMTTSVNSYAKHCGDNAIQCAKDDLLGQALEALRILREDMEMLRDGEWDGSEEGCRASIDTANRVLDKIND